MERVNNLAITWGLPILTGFVLTLAILMVCGWYNVHPVTALLISWGICFLVGLFVIGPLQVWLRGK